MSKRVAFTVTDEEYRNLHKKAQSFGLTISAYLRVLSRDSVRRNPEAQQAEILQSFRKLVVVLAEGLGRSQGISEREVEKLSNILLERYEKGLPVVERN